MMGAEATRSDLDISTSNSGLFITDLVAIGAKVPSSTVEGTTCIFQRHRLFISRQGEIGLCIGGVDVMAGAAIIRRDVRHAFDRRIVRGQSGIDTCLSSLRAMTTSTVSACASLVGLACSMHRMPVELRFLGKDQSGVIVALGAG